ncbi:MAG: TolC family protein [Terracidiphilus sp.]|nr:TolC family protein [Terracidiphilus sp.]
MQISRKLFLLVAALLVARLGAAAQAPDAGRLTLQQAVIMALDKSPDHRIAALDRAVAQAAARKARTTMLPVLAFDETITRGNDPVYAFGTRLRQQRFTQEDFALNRLNRPTPINDFTTRISGSWTAFDMGQTQFRIRQADLLRASAEAATSRADQELVHRVVTAYESVLLAGKRVEVARHQVKTAESLVAASKSRVSAGVVVEADELSASANLAARQQEEIAAEGNLSIAWAELEQAAGAPIPEPERTLQIFAAKQFDVPLLADAVATALQMRPDRTSLEKQQAASHAGVQAARAALGPTVGTFGSWQTDRDSFAGSGGNNWTAGVQIKLDILPLARRQDLESAKISALRTQAVLDSADDAIRLDVTRAWYAQQAASRMLGVAQAAQAQSEESLRILRNRYEAGLATVTDLLRAEDAERQGAANYWQSAFQNTLAVVDLRSAMGTLSPEHLEDLQ